MAPPATPTSIGHYIVERELGRGAMGVVFLASDTRLGRRVAIKALPSELALDPLRQMKFEREARTLAAVNHPNIGAIFGIEEAQGARYLVLELVEGETLAERLAFAPPVDELGGLNALDVPVALEICRQVAAGMAAAHEQGIIHRDLKPANIKIRPDGLVKVLDFGIARGGPVEASLQPRPAADAPTVISSSDAPTSTHVGTIIGTPGYMSPEQARGRPVGKATDLWSFGCMIYECLAGKVAFPGDTLADALAATITSEPDYTALPRRTPVRVIALMKSCFVKDHHKRLGDFGEARLELERAIQELSSAGGGRAVAAATIDPPPPGELEGWPGPTGNLPGDDTTFIGRAVELAEVSRLLASARHVSLVGPAGIGKTRLALSAARAAELGYACGAWFVEAAAAGPASDALVSVRLAAAIGARPTPGEGTIEAVLRLIGRRRALIVIDNCQFAAPTVGRIATAFAESCPRATLLTVGREPLGVRGEQVYRVTPMTLHASNRDGAPALLRERARIAKATLDATPQSTEAMVSLCQKLQGVPLPIELAGAWAESALFEDVVEKLGAHLRARGAASLEAQPVDQIVGLLVEWAYEQITEGERGMLRRLSIFAGGCTLRAAAAISGAADSFPDPQNADPAGGPVTQQEARVLDILGRLATLSLVSVRRSADGSPASTRFIPHEPVRLLARQRLMEFTGSVSVMKRHVQYFAALGEQATPRLRSAEGPVWAARLLAELPNILLAGDIATTVGESGAAARLGEHVRTIYQYCGLPPNP